MEFATATDQASWMQVRQAAAGLNEQCARQKGYRYKGGWISAGEQGFIVIRLSWAGNGLEEG